MTITQWIYRADITGLDSGGNPTVFRYATSGYRTSPSHPSLPNTWFDGRLQQPLLLRRNLYGQAHTYGDAEIAHGTTELSNSDGGLDSLLNYGFDAQAIYIWRINPAAPDTEYLEFRGQVESFTCDVDVMTFLVRDATFAFDVALQPTKYAGSNSLPNGLEGTANDIKGHPKPICVGVNFNLEPILVNTSRLIYQFNDAALGTGYSLTVYDKRIQISAGIQRSLSDFQSGASSATVSSIDTVGDVITTSAAHGFSTADPVHVDSTGTVPGGLVNTQYYYARVLSTTTFTLHPTATDATNNTNRVDITSAGSGTITVAKNRTPYTRYDWCSDTSGSYMRLGSTPQGKVTMDVTNPVTGSGGSVSSGWTDILYYLVNRFGSYNIDNRVSGSVLNVGVYWTTEMTVYDAIRQILASINGSFQIYPNRASPTGVPVYLTVHQIIATTLPSPSLALDVTSITEKSLKVIQPQDAERGIPAWRITCNYMHNRTVMSGADVSGAALADVAFTALGYRTVQNDNVTLKNQFPNSPEHVVNTDLTNLSDAQSLASYFHNLLGSASVRMYELSVSLDVIDSLSTGSGSLVIPGLMLTQVVSVTFPRYGLTNGKSLGVVEYVIDFAQRTMDMTLWG